MEMLSDTSESLNRKDREGRAKDAKKTYRTQGPFPQRSFLLASFAAFLRDLCVEAFLHSMRRSPTPAETLIGKASEGRAKDEKKTHTARTPSTLAYTPTPRWLAAHNRCLRARCFPATWGSATRRR